VVTKIVTLRFSSHHKLKNASDFSNVFKGATVSQSGDYLLLLGKPSEEPVNRIGMVIAKKNVPRAVDRNKIKRVMREVFRNQPKLNIDNCLDIVLLVRKRIPQRTAGSLYQRLESLLNQLLEKARVNKERSHNADTSY